MNDSKTCKSLYNIKQPSNYYKPILVNVCLGAKPTSSSSSLLVVVVVVIGNEIACITSSPQSVLMQATAVVQSAINGAIS